MGLTGNPVVDQSEASILHPIDSPEILSIYGCYQNTYSN